MFNTAFQISRGPERHVPKLSIAYKLLDVHVHALTQNICTEKKVALVRLLETGHTMKVIRMNKNDLLLVHVNLLIKPQ